MEDGLVLDLLPASRLRALLRPLYGRLLAQPLPFLGQPGGLSGLSPPLALVGEPSVVRVPGFLYRSVVCTHCEGNGRTQEIEPSSLKRHRISCGLSLREFARRSGLRPGYVCDVEAGRRKVTRKVLAAYRGLGGEG